MNLHTAAVPGIVAESMNAELDAADPALVGNDELLAALMLGSSDCIKVLDLDGKLQFMSEGGKRVMEVDDFSVLKGCPWPDFWANEGNAAAKNAVEMAKNGKRAQFFGAANTAKGTPKYWDVQVLPVWGKNGRPSHLLSISKDITDTKVAEETAARLYQDVHDATAREAESMRRLLQNAPSFMCVLEGPEHVFKITNNAYMGLVGHRDLIGLKVRDALPELAGQGFYELLDDVYASGMAFVGRGLKIDVQRQRGAAIESAYLNFVYQPIYDDKGSVTGIFVEGSEITDLKQAEFALQAKELQLTLALDAAGMGVWESTLSGGSFIDLKEDARAAHLLASAPEGDPSYESFVSRVHEDDRPLLAEAVKHSIDPEGDGILDVEYRILARPGYPEHWLHARAAAVPEDGQTRFVGTVRDITHRKAAEAQQQLLAGELQHRIKNTFAMVSAIASQTLRGDAVAEQREMFSGRLLALGQAQELLLDTPKELGSMRETVMKALGPHRDEVDRFTINGHNVVLSPKQTLSLALAVHELATNATKYGALSTERGRVLIEWDSTGVDDYPLGGFLWQESDGPTVVEPIRKGFGSRVISRVFAADFGGEVVIRYAPTGLVCTFACRAPLLEEAAT